MRLFLECQVSDIPDVQEGGSSSAAITSAVETGDYVTLTCADGVTKNYYLCGSHRSWLWVNSDAADCAGPVVPPANTTHFPPCPDWKFPALMVNVGDTYTVTLPGYPNLYPNNANCYWRFYVRNTAMSPIDNSSNVECPLSSRVFRGPGSCLASSTSACSPPASAIATN